MRIAGRWGRRSVALFCGLVALVAAESVLGVTTPARMRHQWEATTPGILK
jgi:hypothetical protein